MKPGILWMPGFYRGASFVRVAVEVTETGAGFRPPILSAGSVADALPEHVTPDDVRRVLQSVGESIVIFDEFDRIKDKPTNRLIADTIKNLSDNQVASTVFLVGIADTVDDLFAEHKSIDRSLVEIEMPRMSDSELREIILKAHNKLSMTTTENAMDLIVLLSQGLPHYTHLIGMNASKSAIARESREVCLNDVHDGIKFALSETKQTIWTAYQEAVRSQRTDAIFKQVLLACALAEVDELGFFISASVREPLSQITGKEYDIPGFSQHLNAFSEKTRGEILEKKGTSRRFRFRFENPLLQPYIIMKGLADGMLEGNLRQLLERKRR